MEKFADYKRLFPDVNQMIIDELSSQESKEEIINYNQKSQLSEGIDALGQKIYTVASEEQRSPYPYAFYTAEIRGEAGLQVENVDLNFSGGFWKTFDVKVTEKETEVIANFNSPGEDIRKNFDRKFDFLGLIYENLEGFVWNGLFPRFAISLKQVLRIS